MSGLSSYPKVLTLGRPESAAVFFGRYVIEEKLDGSQFSFGVTAEGELRVRSKGAVIDPEVPPNLFANACATVLRLFNSAKLFPGTTYRAEALQSRRHNTLAYERAPEAGFVLFDVESHDQGFYRDRKQAVAEDLGVECIRRLGEGDSAPTEAMMDAMLYQDSMLGGTKVEGVVFKNYNQPSQYGPMAWPVTFVKYVNPAFREMNDKAWRENRTTATADVVGTILSGVNREAVWTKAVQHLRDAGELESDPRDIGKLLREVNVDFEAENTAAIKDLLYKRFRIKVMKGLTTGFPEWYKAQIATSVLADE